MWHQNDHFCNVVVVASRRCRAPPSTDLYPTVLISLLSVIRYTPFQYQYIIFIPWTLNYWRSCSPHNNEQNQSSVNVNDEEDKCFI